MQGTRRSMAQQLRGIPASVPRASFVCRASKGFGGKPAKAPASNPADQEPCPCNSERSYKKCCGVYHNDAKAAPSPEAIARARFSAYVRGRSDYIKSTTHPDYFPFHYQKPQAEAQGDYDRDVSEGCSSFVYADFKVVQTEPGAHDAEAFVAYTYKSAKKPADGQKVPDDQWLITNEKDRFLQVSGKWQVVDYQVYDHNLSQLLSNVEAEGKPAAAAKQ